MFDNFVKLLGDEAFGILKIAAPIVIKHLDKNAISALVLMILLDIFEHHDKDIENLGKAIVEHPEAYSKINDMDLKFCKVIGILNDASNKK
jgi:hypothetical protein